MTTSAPNLRQTLSWLGHRAREAALWPQVLRGKSGTRLAFLPSASGPGSSDLRARAMALALGQIGWQTLCLPPQLELGQRARLLRAFAPDLVVFQQARHALNRAEHAFGLPFVLDMDDADFCDPTLAPHLEALARQGRGVIAGSRHIRDWARGLGATSEVVWTGTKVTEGPRPPHGARAPIIAWAQAAPLGYPAEMAFVETVLTRVAAERPDVILRLYGVNSAQDAAVLRARFGFVTLQLMPSLPYDRFLLSLREVALGLSPIIPDQPFSLGKSFGKILGYLDARVPVICADQADHALFFTPASGVVSEDPAVWSAQALALLADPPARDAMAGAAFADLQSRLSLPATARRLGQVLDRMRKG